MSLCQQTDFERLANVDQKLAMIKVLAKKKLKPEALRGLFVLI